MTDKKIVQTKEREIDGKKYEVRELVVDEWKAGYRIVSKMENVTDVLKHIDKLLPYTSNVTKAELEKMAPSEIKLLWDDFKEVNSVFFSMIEVLGLSEVLNKIRMILIEAFVMQSSSLLAKVLK